MSHLIMVETQQSATQSNSMKDYIYSIGIAWAAVFVMAIVIMPAFLWLTMPDLVWANIVNDFNATGIVERLWFIKVMFVVATLAGLFVGAMKPFSSPRLGYIKGTGELVYTMPDGKIIPAHI